MNLCMRPARDDDEDFAFRVKKYALGAYVAQTWGWDESFQRAFHHDDWSLHRPDIIECEGEVIGTLEVSMHNDHMYIGEFYLFQNWQRRGIGTQLLRGVLARVDELRLEARLQFLKVNPVRSLYERNGFVIVGDTATHYLAVRPRQIEKSNAAL